MSDSFRSTVRLLVLVACLVPAASWSQSTILYIRSLTGDYIGQGQTFTWTPPALVATATRFSSSEVRFSLANAGTTFTLNLAAREGTNIGVGPYEEAARTPFRGTSPGVEFTGDGRGCNQLQGRFVVLESDISLAGTVNAFAANFEQWCDNSPAPLYGEIRFNSSIPLSFAGPTPDGTPDPFALLAQSPVAAGATVLSNRITVYGVSTGVPISITGGQYSLNGGSFTSANGTAANLAHIVVRMVASPTPGATTQATLTVGGVSATLSVVTYAPGMVLSGIYYNSSSGDYIGQGLTRMYLAPRNEIIASRNFDNGVEFELNGTGGTWFYLDLAAPGDAVLAPGAYENATRWPFQAPAEPGLDFSGEGRGCGSLTGRFVVHEAVFNMDGSVQSFAADFEQHCETSTAPPLFGEVRYNSTYPFSALAAAPPPAAPTHMSNLATRAQVLTGQDVMIMGFVISGATNKTVGITATGPSLARYGIATPLQNPTLTLVRQSDNAIIAVNDNWRDAPNALAIEWNRLAPPNDNESAMLISLAPGAYTVIVSGVGGGTGVAVAAVYEMAQPAVRLLNLSTRGRVGSGENVMIGGFVVLGSGPQPVTIVATGPSLSAYGITNPLANPTLTLVRQSDQAVVATNDDWQSAPNAAQIQSAGFAPPDALESAILVNLDPGAYTAIVSGTGGATGVAVIGIYAGN